MSVQGIASVWTKAKDSKTYRLIHYIVSKDEEELLVSFRDQVTLKILPASYPYHLCSDDEKETDKFPEEEEVITAYDEGEDEEAQVVYRVFAKILEHQAENFIPSDRTEEQDLIADLKEEEEELIRKKSPLEQKLINEFRDVFSQSLTQDQALKNADADNH